MSILNGMRKNRAPMATKTFSKERIVQLETQLINRAAARVNRTLIAAQIFNLSASNVASKKIAGQILLHSEFFTSPVKGVYVLKDDEEILAIRKKRSSELEALNNFGI